jgi:hypothetical protein
MALAALTVVLRSLWLGDRQLFRDEAASWLTARYPLSELLARAATEPFPPLYTILLKGWMSLVGDSEGTLRAFSVLAALAMAIVAWRWAHEALGRWPGLVVLLFVALSPLAIANARSVRMYALESALATVAWWLTWRLISGRTSGRVSARLHALGLTAAVAGTVWTLPVGLPTAGLQWLVAAGALVFAAGRLPRPAFGRRRPAPAGLVAADRPLPSRDGAAGLADRSGAAWATAAITVGALTLLPWLPNILPAATSGEPYWTPRPGTFDWAVTWGTMLVGWREELPGWKEYRVVALAIAALGIVWLLRQRAPALRLLGWCVAAGMALTIAFWSVSLVRSIYDTRYLAASLPPLAIAVAAGGEAIARLLQRVLFAGEKPENWRFVPRLFFARKKPEIARLPERLLSAPENRETARPSVTITRRAPWPAAARLLLAALILAAAVPQTRAWLDEWRWEVGLGPTRELARALSSRLRAGDVVLTLDARSFFPLAYEAEMLARRGQPLAAPLRTWDSGHEPFYRGQALIRDEDTISAAEVAAHGWRRAVPELGAHGNIWLVAIANGRVERLGFRPLASGEVRELDRVVTERSGEMAQARRLEVSEP